MASHSEDPRQPARPTTPHPEESRQSARSMTPHPEKSRQPAQSAASRPEKSRYPERSAAPQTHSTAPHSGWYLPAFTSELEAEVTPLEIGTRRLVAVRTETGLRVFDADCPHRGAHLGYGGRLSGGCLVCPFHGRRIALGDAAGRLSVREHHVIVSGEAVFVRLSDGPDDDRGLTRALKELEATHPLTAAVTRPLAADPALVVENAFDVDHFTEVHKVPRLRGMAHRDGDEGELVIEGEFVMGAKPGSSSGQQVTRAGFLARAYSPGVVVTRFGPPGWEQVIVTAAVPYERGGCVARVAIGVRPEQRGELPLLIHGSERALEEDAVIWERLNPRAVPRFDSRDVAVLAYREFCATFGEPT
ncbi:Rieske 2Fe-2S domain-containing protein [Streptosporangium sp. NPDC049078]|uniref:Rieske 2Fe-2S domain-containing protein n=1 Tax=Streptosporangium sp. NPDC049078 TaxID=3155767 RepID=UPI003414E54C